MKKTKKRPSGQSTKPVHPDVNRESTQPAPERAATEAPVTSTAPFKAGRDLLS